MDKLKASFAADCSCHTTWRLSEILLLGFLVYTVGLALFTARVTTWYLRIPHSSEKAQAIGTDSVRLTPYWDMDLATLSEESSRRGFLGTHRKKFLVRWLIENDYPWMRCM